MKVKVSFLSSENRVLQDIFGEKELYSSFLTKKNIADGIEVQLGRLRVWEILRAQPFELYVIFILPVALSILSSWLYDTLKDKTEKITIEGVTIKVDLGEIEQLLEMLIEKEKQSKEV